MSDSNLVFRLVVVAALVLAAGCGGETDGLQISDARVGAPTGPNAAMYFTAQGAGEDDALIAATTDVASEVKIHETVHSDSGTMSMRSLSRLDLPAGGQLVLEPGGLHLMLVGVDELAVGGTIEVVLVWEVAGEMTVEAEVVEPADTMGEHEDT
ncbi:MAG: copper chaperone PCu(A)C [Acidimicrobiia bacterium]